MKTTTDRTALTGKRAALPPHTAVSLWLTGTLLFWFGRAPPLMRRSLSNKRTDTRKAVVCSGKAFIVMLSPAMQLATLFAVLHR